MQSAPVLCTEFCYCTTLIAPPKIDWNFVRRIVLSFQNFQKSFAWLLHQGALCKTLRYFKVNSGDMWWIKFIYKSFFVSFLLTFSTQIENLCKRDVGKVKLFWPTFHFSIIFLFFNFSYFLVEKLNMVQNGSKCVPTNNTLKSFWIWKVNLIFILSKNLNWLNTNSFLKLKHIS